MDLSPGPNQSQGSGEPKRRRIIIEDEDEVGSNPDELIDDEEVEKEDEEGEDLMETWAT
jgi:hypothetical protein